MKLGKTLDLSKCFYDKDHWTHPDLKEGQLYIVNYKENILSGYFHKLKLDYGYGFYPIDYFREKYEEYKHIKFGSVSHKNPLQEGWKHIQEVIV